MGALRLIKFLEVHLLDQRVWIFKYLVERPKWPSRKGGVSFPPPENSHHLWMMILVQWCILQERVVVPSRDRCVSSSFLLWGSHLCSLGAPHCKNDLTPAAPPKPCFCNYSCPCLPCSLPPNALSPSLSLSGCSGPGSPWLPPALSWFFLLQHDIRASGRELEVAPGNSLQPGAFLSFPLHAGEWIWLAQIRFWPGEGKKARKGGGG